MLRMHDLDSKLERAMDALRCPPEDQLVENLSGVNAVAWLFVVCCFKNRIYSFSMSLPTTWMRVYRLARTTSPTV